MELVLPTIIHSATTRENVRNLNQSEYVPLGKPKLQKHPKPLSIATHSTNNLKLHSQIHRIRSHPLGSYSLYDYSRVSLEDNTEPISIDSADLFYVTVAMYRITGRKRDVRLAVPLVKTRGRVFLRATVGLLPLVPVDRREKVFGPFLVVAFKRTASDRLRHLVLHQDRCMASS